MTILYVSMYVWFQLQGAGAADVGGDYGDVDIQWPGLRQREGHSWHKVHIHASGSDAPWT